MPAPFGTQSYLTPKLQTTQKLQKLQTTQNSALRVVTGCTPDTNTQHLHKETKTLPLSNHLKLHASQLRQKSQLPTHPLHNLTKQSQCPRKKKQTIFDDWGKKTVSITNSNTIPTTPETISQNLKTIQTTIADECLKSYEPNSILSEPAPDINPSEQTLPHKTRRILAQLRTGKSLIHRSNTKIDPTSHSSPTCPLCNSQVCLFVCLF